MDQIVLCFYKTGMIRSVVWMFLIRHQRWVHLFQFGCTSSCNDKKDFPIPEPYGNIYHAILCPYFLINRFSFVKTGSINEWRDSCIDAPVTWRSMPTTTNCVAVDAFRIPACWCPSAYSWCPFNFFHPVSFFFVLPLKSWTTTAEYQYSQPVFTLDCEHACMNKRAHAISSEGMCAADRWGQRWGLHRPPAHVLKARRARAPRFNFTIYVKNCKVLLALIKD